MKIIKKLILISIFLTLLGCGGGWEDFKGALSGSKKKTTDEYLIKEKDPLILPPDYKNLPLPDSKKTKKKSDTIESILSQDKLSEDESNKKSPLETSIEEELRKGN
tara:strand:- start:113 stop:430 length:318 start_codon:yes stop_codon:yes gene_type:complete